MSLAFNQSGEPFEVPASVTGWRVRRMKARGAPEVLYGRDGAPLVIAADAEIDDLRAAVEEAGRYRLEGVDDNGRSVADVPIAYAQISAPVATTPSATRVGGDDAIGVMREAMRLNTELARAVVDRFPAMLEASAILLRAADGAGLPARPPMALGDGDLEPDVMPPAPSAAPGFDLSGLVAQVVPVVVAKLFGGGELPSLAAMLDWRKAAPKAVAPAREPSSASPAAPTVGVPRGDTPADAMPVLSPQAMAHFVAVQAALTAEERALALEAARTLTATERNAWIAELSGLTVAEAAARIRALIAAPSATAGGAA